MVAFLTTGRAKKLENFCSGAFSWTWCALAMGFLPCLSRKRPFHGLGSRSRWPFPPACRGKGRLMDFVRVCDGLFPLPVKENAVLWTWCALAMGFSLCLSKKRPSHGLGGSARDGLFSRERSDLRGGGPRVRATVFSSRFSLKPNLWPYPKCCWAFTWRSLLAACRSARKGSPLFARQPAKPGASLGGWGCLLRALSKPH